MGERPSCKQRGKTCQFRSTVRQLRALARHASVRGSAQTMGSTPVSVDPVNLIRSSIGQTRFSKMVKQANSDQPHPSRAWSDAIYTYTGETASQIPVEPPPTWFEAPIMHIDSEVSLQLPVPIPAKRKQHQRRPRTHLHSKASHPSVNLGQTRSNSHQSDPSPAR